MIRTCRRSESHMEVSRRVLPPRAPRSPAKCTESPGFADSAAGPMVGRRGSHTSQEQSHTRKLNCEDAEYLGVTMHPDAPRCTKSIFLPPSLQGRGWGRVATRDCHGSTNRQPPLNPPRQGGEVFPHPSQGAKDGAPMLGRSVAWLLVQCLVAVAASTLELRVRLLPSETRS